MENENIVVTETGVNEQQPAEVAEVTTETGTETAVTPETQPQSAETNAMFAARRRQQEQAQAEADRAEYERIQQALQAYGYTGTPTDIADQLQAHAQNTTVEAVRTAREQEANQKKAASEADYYRNQLNDILIGRDIDTVKAKYPQIDGIEDMPDGWVEIMATGKVSPLTAYEMLAPKAATPPTTGSVKNNQTIDKEFYTNDELDALSAKDLDDPKIFEKAMKSLSRLK